MKCLIFLIQLFLEDDFSDFAEGNVKHVPIWWLAQDYSVGSS